MLIEFCYHLAYVLRASILGGSKLHEGGYEPEKLPEGTANTVLCTCTRRRTMLCPRFMVNTDSRQVFAFNIQDAFTTI